MPRRENRPGWSRSRARARRFKLSTDPRFVEKLRDVVGLYLNPPAKAVVFCVDEKSDIQALDRTHPCSRCGRAFLNARRMITCDTARPRSTQPCGCWTASSSANVGGGTGVRSLSDS